MNKDDLILEISKATCTKAEAARAWDAAMEAMKKALKKGEKVTLTGFGTFAVVKRAARNARNPRTGEWMKIEGRNAPKFTAGKALREYVK
jgi:DNA-binding protein HU-beta